MKDSALTSAVSDLDLRLLRIFLAVAENGGFAAAEFALNINRSTISIHIADLEHRLGMRLCNRSRGKSAFSLTAQGQALYECAREMEKYLEGFRYQVNSIQTELTGLLRIALPDDWLEMSSVSIDLAELIKSFCEAAPRVDVSIKVGSPEEVDFDILNDRADVGITSILVRRPGLVYVPIFSHVGNLYCSDRHPLWNTPEQELTLEKVLSHPLASVATKAHPDAHRLISLFTRRASAAHMEGRLLLINSGSFLGFLPDYFVKARGHEYRLRKILPEEFSYSCENALISNKSKEKHVLSMKFASMFKLFLDEYRQQQLECGG
jgi:DNA-binding transcriptional LysR family regulator